MYFKVIEKNCCPPRLCQPKLLHSAKPSFIIEGEIKNSYMLNKIKEFVTSNPSLQKILKEILCPGEENKYMKIQERINFNTRVKQ
jgi:hypothetical protein